MKLKKLKEGEPMPYDFWNYNVNPITGYLYEYHRDIKKESKKYGITPIKE